MVSLERLETIVQVERWHALIKPSEGEASPIVRRRERVSHKLDRGVVPLTGSVERLFQLDEVGEQGVLGFRHATKGVAWSGSTRKA